MENEQITTDSLLKLISTDPDSVENLIREIPPQVARTLDGDRIVLALTNSGVPRDATSEFIGSMPPLSKDTLAKMITADPDMILNLPNGEDADVNLWLLAFKAAKATGNGFVSIDADDGFLDKKTGFGWSNWIPDQVKTNDRFRAALKDFLRFEAGVRGVNEDILRIKHLTRYLG